MRLVAGDAGVSSELLALVHAAKRLQKQGKRVVWDYANAAATCPCGDVSSRSKDDEDTTTRASFARRLLRLSASSPGASLCVSGASARETNNGWTTMFASASDAFTDASAESDDSACRTALPQKAREAIDTELVDRKGYSTIMPKPPKAYEFAELAPEITAEALEGVDPRIDASIDPNQWGVLHETLAVPMEAESSRVVQKPLGNHKDSLAPIFIRELPEPKAPPPPKGKAACALL